VTGTDVAHLEGGRNQGPPCLPRPDHPLNARPANNPPKEHLP
jgi:hypothetical protein